MILSHKGHLGIDGSNVELFIEFAAIYESFLTSHPELIAACSIEYEDALLQALTDTTPEHIDAANFVVKEFKKGNKDYE